MDAQTKQALAMVLDTFLEAIKAAGPKGIPSGHLYAMVMGQFPLNTYNAIIGALKATNKIKEDNHLLTAV